MKTPILSRPPKPITVAIGDTVRGLRVTSISGTSASSVIATVVTACCVDDVGDVHFMRWDGRSWGGVDL